jgi:hypothetical protein
MHLFGGQVLALGGAVLDVNGNLASIGVAVNGLQPDILTHKHKQTHSNRRNS